MEQQKSNIWSTEKVNKCIEHYNKTGILPNPSPFYNGDIRYRKARLNFEYTAEEIKEMAKCENDILYYAESYAHVATDEGVRQIKLRNYQIRILQQFVYYRNNILLASRQCGKSIFGKDLDGMDFYDLYSNVSHYHSFIFNSKIAVEKVMIYLKKHRILSWLQLILEILHIILTKILYRRELNTILNEDETILSYNIPQKVFSNGNKIEKLHICQPTYHYTIKFNNGDTIIVSDDHPIMKDGEQWRLKDHLPKGIKFSFFKRSIYVHYDGKFTISGYYNHSRICMITRSFFKLYGYSFSANGDNTYYLDNVLLHNCVTAETEITVYDSQKKQKYSIPIYELYYRNMKNKTFLDKLEYWLQKVIVKLKKKIYGQENQL